MAAPAAGKENVAEDARAIAADAARLRPLLAKAQRLQAAQAARSQPQAAGSGGQLPVGVGVVFLAFVGCTF